MLLPKTLGCIGNMGFVILEKNPDHMSLKIPPAGSFQVP